MVKKMIPLMFGLIFLTSLMCWIVLPDHFTLNLSLSVVCVILLSLWGMDQRIKLLHFFKSTYFVMLTQKLTSFVLIFCIFAGLSFVFYKKPKVFDFTKQKVNTISDKSKKILDLFQSEIEAEVYGTSDDLARYHSMLNLYRHHRHDFTIKLVDMQLHPSKVKVNQIQKAGEVILSYQGRKIKSSALSEVELTSGLIKLVRDDQFHIVFSTGHGELNWNGASEQSIQFLRNELASQNYVISQIDLSQEKIASKTDLIVFVGPTQRFMPAELEKINQYQLAGGNIAFFLDPSLNSLDPLKELRAWLASNKMTIANDVVVDKLSTMEGADPSILIIKKFSQDSNIVKNLQGRVIMPLTSSIRVQGLEFEPLLISSPFPACWAEQNIEQLKSGQVVFDQNDIKGPLDLVGIATLENSNKVFLAGSSRWIMDGYANNPTNINLVVNAMSSMMGDASLVSLNRPGFLQERIFISEIQTQLILYGTVILGPLLLLLVAFLFYRRRVRWIE